MNALDTKIDNETGDKVYSCEFIVVLIILINIY